MTEPLTIWQAAAFAETPMRTTSRHPAPEEDGTRVGVDLSKSLTDYISGSHGFPVKAALLDWDEQCRKRHQHWPDHRGRPACAFIAWSVIYYHTSVKWAAGQLDMTPLRALRLLRPAVRYMRRRHLEWMSQVPMSEARHDPESCHECLLADPQRRREHDQTTCYDCRNRSAA